MTLPRSAFGDFPLVRLGGRRRRPGQAGSAAAAGLWLARLAVSWLAVGSVCALAQVGPAPVAPSSGISAVDAATALANLPRPNTPPPERGEVVPAQVERWRKEGEAFEHGSGQERDPVRAAELYCRAARYGDAEAQYSLAWMYTNARGIERNDAAAAHLFAAAAEQGHAQSANMARRLGTPIGPPPPCLRPPEADVVAQAPVAPTPTGHNAGNGGGQTSKFPPLPVLRGPVPEPILNYVRLIAPEYKLEPALVLAVMAAESNFDPAIVSPKNAQGLMQLIPETGRRFGVRNLFDASQNIRAGMAYLRWLLAYFEGDVSLALAAYNAGEGAVDRYLGVPPYAETRMYVLKILVSLGGRRSHPFDATATTPSAKLPLMRNLWTGRR